MRCADYCLNKLEEAESCATAGDASEAIRRFQEAISYASVWHVRVVEAAARERLGDLEEDRGDLYTAESEYRAALSLWMDLLPAHDQHLVSLRGRLAYVCLELKHSGDAGLIASHALRLAEAAQDAAAAAIARNNLAALRLMSNSPWAASELLTALIKEPGELAAVAFHNLGVLECLCGRYRQAVSLLAWAEVLFAREECPNPRAVQACEENLGRVRSLCNCSTTEHVAG